MFATRRQASTRTGPLRPSGARPDGARPSCARRIARLNAATAEGVALVGEIDEDESWGELPALGLAGERRAAAAAVSCRAALPAVATGVGRAAEAQPLPVHQLRLRRQLPDLGTARGRYRSGDQSGAQPGPGRTVQGGQEKPGARPGRAPRGALGRRNCAAGRERAQLGRNAQRRRRHPGGAASDHRRAAACWGGNR